MLSQRGGVGVGVGVVPPMASPLGLGVGPVGPVGLGGLTQGLAQGLAAPFCSPPERPDQPPDMASMAHRHPGERPELDLEWDFSLVTSHDSSYLRSTALARLPLHV